MTTIVYNYKDKQIALDSRTTNGWMIVSDKSIKYKKDNDLMWFLSGRSGQSETFISNFKELECAHKALDNVGFFVKNKVVYLANICDGIFRSCAMSCNSGAGSGSDWALAALDMGKSTKEAVEYAITKDYGSGGKVHVYDILKGEFL